MVQIKVIDIENAIGGIARSFGFKVGAAAGRLFEVRVRHQLKDDPEVASLIEPLFEIRRFLRAQFEVLDKRMRTAAAADPICRRLMTAPGIGPIAALTYRCVIDAPERFRRSQTVGAHLGLTPRTRQSGEVDV